MDANRKRRRREHRQIEIVVAKLGENLAEPCRRVGLKAGRADVAQHRVIAGFVG
jgi:hypothetical protein